MPIKFQYFNLILFIENNVHFVIVFFTNSVILARQCLIIIKKKSFTNIFGHGHIDPGASMTVTIFFLTSHHVLTHLHYTVLAYSVIQLANGPMVPL